MKYKEFVFSGYEFDVATKKLSLQYAIDDVFRFTETYTFDFDFIDYDSQALDRAFQMLFFTAGVSYYKTFLPEKIVSRAPGLDRHTAQYMQQTYQRGLSEFFYVNNLDPSTPVIFPANPQERTVRHSLPNNKGLLVGIGGGKDSLLSVELLKETKLPLATWSLNHKKQLQPLIERIGLPHFWVERTWDSKLAELNKNGAYNGHVPISAIFAAVGTVVCILSGFHDHIVSNEQSANAPTLEYRGVSVNHQYSKSQVFERDFQALLQGSFGDDIRYYSLLRPLSELRVAELFAHKGFEKYHDVFSSCNKAYVHDSPGLFWDGACSKCAFVYLVLAPFVEEAELMGVIGHNLLLDDSLEPTFRQLLGIQGDKPLECVGEIEESRAALRMMQKTYPELSRYEFELPQSYDFRARANHEIPPEIFELIETQL